MVVKRAEGRRRVPSRNIFTQLIFWISTYPLFFPPTR